MMAWPEGPGTARTVTGPRTDSAAAGGARQTGTAPTAPRRAAEANLPRSTRPQMLTTWPPLLCPVAEPSQSQARYRATPWSSLVAGLASTSLRGPAPQRDALTMTPAR